MATPWHRRRFYAVPDTPDARDRIYSPPARAMRAQIDPRREDTGTGWSRQLVRDQEERPYCTGYAVAAATDILLARERIENKSRSPRDLVERHGFPYASAVMLYANARFHDEWPGEMYRGSSLRGTLKGFQHNGVLRAHENEDDDFEAVARRRMYRREVSDQARQIVLGNYWRVIPRLDDFHAALSHVGVMVATARVTRLWSQARELIPFHEDAVEDEDSPIHAFAIIGFNDKGFIVHNSWGLDWGEEGTSVWTYADWAANIVDGWVMRLAVWAPTAFAHSFGAQGVHSLEEAERMESRRPSRLDVLGHFVPIEDGEVLSHGRFHVDRPTVAFMAEEIAVGTECEGGITGARTPYTDVLIMIGSGVQPIDDYARAARRLRPLFARAGIYPIFVPWEARMLGAVDREVRRIIAMVTQEVGHDAMRTTQAARIVEAEVADVPARMVMNLEATIDRLFAPGSRDPAAPITGADFLAQLFGPLMHRLGDGSLRLHLLAHGAGAVVLQRGLLTENPPWGHRIFSTVHLVSPLLALKSFNDVLLPLIARVGDGPAHPRARRTAPVIEALKFYILDSRIASGDLFDERYPRSWPELWCRAIAMMKHGPDYIDIDRSETESRARFLAIQSYLKIALREAARQRAMVDGYRVGTSHIRQLGGLSHFGLATSSAVVQAVISSIRGDEPEPTGRIAIE